MASPLIDGDCSVSYSFTINPAVVVLFVSIARYTFTV